MQHIASYSITHNRGTKRRLTLLSLLLVLTTQASQYKIMSLGKRQNSEILPLLCLILILYVTFTGSGV